MSHWVARVLGLAVFAASLWAGPREAEWKQVAEAVDQGLPKTAMERLDPIIAAAVADRAYPEATKAIARKITLERQIQGDGAEEAIVRMQAQLEKAPAAMKPAMEAILARWYWQYFQQNRWRFLQRTQTGAPSGPDLQTWDLARIFSEIDRHFMAALADEATLKATPIRDYDELIEPGTVPDRYRPTLYDFFTYEALQFYQAGEHAGLAGEDEFEISADSPIFSEVDAFANWKPDTTDTTSPKLQAIRLYQGLLAFHRSDADRSAFYDADLARLTFGHNSASDESKDERYKAALERFIAITAQHEISARARAALAGQLNAEGEAAKAHEMAQRGYDAFPESVGGVACLNLLHQIEAKSAALQTERVWNAPWPTLNLTYRNITKVYFRAVKVDFVKYIESDQTRNEGVDPTHFRDFLAAPPTLAWAEDLPPTKNYKDRTERLPAPTSLQAGFYILIASHDPGFGDKDNQLSAVPIWVSDLTLVTRLRNDQETQSGLVLRANSGEPVADAVVNFWQPNPKGNLRRASSTKTDANGEFHFSGKNWGVVILAEQGGQAIASHDSLYTYYSPPHEETESRTVFFTDRALYRPGQAIHYKGVSVRYNQNQGSYSALSDYPIVVVFNDANGREIARANHRTNDYGSFNGVFTAPRDGALGRMTIQVLGRPSLAAFNVEEYKRPKFRVEIKAPTEAAKLGAVVEFVGKATAYTGAAINGAKVKWHVERGVRLPSWCWWWQPPAAKAIAHGTAVTDADGSFTVQFPAEPDRKVAEKSEPTFTFTLQADVTDTTGETRSDRRSVSAGYTTLSAELSANDWQTTEKPVDLGVTTTSLDDDPQAANGLLRIYELIQPAAVSRSALQPGHQWWNRAVDEPEVNPANPDSWSLGPLVAEKPFATDRTGKQQVAVPLNVGIYRVMLEAKDRFGKTVTARRTVQVVNPRERRYEVKLANLFVAPKWSVEPGDTFTALWGTGYNAGRAFVELEQNGKILKRYWTAPDRTQETIEQAVKEEMRGGFSLRVTYVRENRAYINERTVDVPWSNKQLTVKWGSFRSKLVPGQKETWTALVTGPDAKRAAAEMVATLYDASLDQYMTHDWPRAFDVFRTEFSRVTSRFQNAEVDFQLHTSWPAQEFYGVAWRYRAFPENIINGGLGDQAAIYMSMGALRDDKSVRYKVQGVPAPAPATTAMMLEDAASAPRIVREANLESAGEVKLGQGRTTEPQPKIDLSKIRARTNLSETAFFFPRLIADENGAVKMEFTMPEALTEWKFLAFAHDPELRAGYLTDKVVTAKDLMVEPNPPRFVREGDAIEFTVKVSNQSDEPQKGTVKLTFADAATLKPMDEALANRVTEHAFDLPAKQSRSYSWRIAVPDGLDFLTYKAVAGTTKFSDGEEGFLPVLSRRVLVTESLPLPIRGKTTKAFVFKKLLASRESKTLQQQSLTVQMVSQPAWYAVMALPYLMEYPYECNEQVFSRLYANALARHIANSDPKIRRVFELWKGTSALDSPLEKNQDLKSVLIEETPWLNQAKSESQARRNVGLLFDANRLNDEVARALHTLSERQLSDGLWSWFPGGRSSEYISLYIMTGFGRLRHLDVEVDLQPALKSIAALDAWMDQRYRRILRQKNPEEYVPSGLDALYLYGRSFFLRDQALSAPSRQAVDFFLLQSRKFWTKVNSRQSQAHLALALQRFGDDQTPQAIMKSLKERSLHDEELGMYWRDPASSWWWYDAPIETQAMMIEAFSEVSHDAQAVEDCGVWLLKQKQTQDWRTTKATADAIYGLLLRGRNLLASDERVEVSLAGETLKPDAVEAGTGFYEKRFVRSEISPTMGRVTVKKSDDGVSWGSLHWQYLEDIAQVTPHEGTPLQLKKALFIKEMTAKGAVLKPVTGPVSVGDELVVRLELRTDRDMEFVHLKDQRGSGTEPVNVLSHYHDQDGLAYYETTRDTASHFFIDYLRKGVYVFEYSVRVQLKGEYQTGLAEIQCMYAPEFNSHSESFTLSVK